MPDQEPEAVAGNRPIPLPRVNPPPQLTLKDGPEDVDMWKIWKQEWTNYSRITQLDKHPMDLQTSMFLHCAGRDILKIYNALQFADGESDVDLPTVLVKLQEYFVGEINETFERWNFNVRDQHPSENVDSYITCLRNMSKTCNFCDVCRESLIRDRIILGIRFRGYQDTKQDLLKVRQLTLKNTIDTCRSAEASQQMTVDMTLNKKSDKEEINKVDVRQKTTKGRVKSRTTTEGGKCKFCAQIHPFQKALCPAWGATCGKCKGNIRRY